MRALEPEKQFQDGSESGDGLVGVWRFTLALRFSGSE